MTEENEQIEEREAPETPETPQREWSDDDEAEARAFGWKPETEWQGNVPAGFIDDPREFMRRAESFGPFRRLRERLDKQDEHLRKIESVTAKQVERAQKQAEADYKARLDRISAEKRRAAQEGDLERYDQLSAQERGLEKPKVEAEAPAAPEDPITPEIREKHKWVSDPFLASQGYQLVEAGLRSGELTKTSTAAEQVAYAETRLKSYFPHMFPSEAKPKPSPVEGGSIASTKKSGFGSLPAEAKQAFSRMVAQGVFKDNDEDRKFYYDEYTGS